MTFADHNKIINRVAAMLRDTAVHSDESCSPHCQGIHLLGMAGSTDVWGNPEALVRFVGARVLGELARARQDVRWDESLEDTARALDPETNDTTTSVTAPHPEDFCHRCHGPNVHTWAAPSPLWNAVMRGGSINGDDEYDGIVCPTCFAILAEERTGATFWRLSAKHVTAQLETVTPSGRVWNPDTWMWETPEPEMDPTNTGGGHLLNGEISIPDLPIPSGPAPGANPSQADNIPPPSGGITMDSHVTITPSSTVPTQPAMPPKKKHPSVDLAGLDPELAFRLGGMTLELTESATQRGYLKAVAALRDDERFERWWHTRPTTHPDNAYWLTHGRNQLADYLETIETRDVTNPSKTIRLDTDLVSWLVTGALDHLWYNSPDAGPDERGEPTTGCCPQCCGPCGALRTLLLDCALDDLARPHSRDSFIWDDERNRLSRAWLNRAWSADCEIDDRIEFAKHQGIRAALSAMLNALESVPPRYLEAAND